MINNKTFPERELQEEEDLGTYFLMRSQKLAEDTARHFLSLDQIINSIENTFSDQNWNSSNEDSTLNK
jgi:hypothetical protein